VQQLAQGGDAGRRKIEEGAINAARVEGEVKKGLPHSGAAQQQGPIASGGGGGACC
jgi:hypothetical protein